MSPKSSDDNLSNPREGKEAAPRSPSPDAPPSSTAERGAHEDEQDNAGTGNTNPTPGQAQVQREELTPMPLSDRRPSSPTLRRESRAIPPSARPIPDRVHSEEGSDDEDDKSARPPSPETRFTLSTGHDIRSVPLGPYNVDFSSLPSDRLQGYARFLEEAEERRAWRRGGPRGDDPTRDFPGLPIPRGSNLVYRPDAQGDSGGQLYVRQENSRPPSTDGAGDGTGADGAGDGSSRRPITSSPLLGERGSLRPSDRSAPPAGHGQSPAQHAQQPGFLQVPSAPVRGSESQSILAHTGGSSSETHTTASYIDDDPFARMRPTFPPSESAMPAVGIQSPAANIDRPLRKRSSTAGAGAEQEPGTKYRKPTVEEDRDDTKS